MLNLQKQPGRKLAISAAVTFFVLGLVLTLNRYYSFYASFDQGIFNQVFWNNLHGRFFESSLSSSLSTNVIHSGDVPEVFYHRLGQHFTPALLLWLPLYALFPFPATLTVLQVTLITAAGGVLYILARQYLEPPLAAMIAASFWSANAVVGPTLANFHDLSQIPLFVFGLLLAMEKRWWWLFSILAVLTLAVREDAGVVLVGVGFYLIYSKRYPRIGLLVCAISLGYMFLVTSRIMPLFSQDVSHRMLLEQFGQYIRGNQASTPLSVVWAMVSNPWRFVVKLFSPVLPKIQYLISHWLPLAFVPAVSPVFWVTAGFPVFFLFLQQGQPPIDISVRYALSVVPGLFYGAILWWSSRQQLFKKRSLRRFWVVCISLSLFFTFTANPSQTFYFLIPDSIRPWVYVSLTEQWEHVGQMRPLLAQIPPDAGVSATTYLVPHLSSRREIIRWPNLQLRNDKREVRMVEYVIADLWQLQQYQSAFRLDRKLLRRSVPLINKLIDNREYGVIGFQDGVILMQRAVASNPQAISAWSNFQQQLQPILKKKLS